MGGLLLLCIACSSVGPFVWVQDYDSKSDAAPAFALSAGDTVQVKVFNQDQLSTRARIRTDGNISLPLLNEVRAAGLTPDALAAQIQSGLKSYLQNPLVTVSVEEARSPSVYVGGEVVKPGSYPLDPAAPGVLGALVAAGGLTPYAHRDRVFVIRSGSSPRIRLTYEALVRAEPAARSFKLLPGDVVVVE